MTVFNTILMSSPQQYTPSRVTFTQIHARYASFPSMVTTRSTQVVISELPCSFPLFHHLAHAFNIQPELMYFTSNLDDGSSPSFTPASLEMLLSSPPPYSIDLEFFVHSRGTTFAPTQAFQTNSGFRYPPAPLEPNNANAHTVPGVQVAGTSDDDTVIDIHYTKENWL